ncbi:hypothetical protein CHU95_05580 [Niveispirillum lacus]|uniref:ATP-binding protein n=1 Tax=Niveispirillum lacus TaxID=1981099 RepID=A0A255Z5T8_9PROT|nr:hypothetical protein [Niveispirillum lacus]OYQ36255.1 hypothetical protein CHU95_05580 [Niveispirillum lacus]
MGGVVTVRSAATVACSVLAVGCVGAFLAPVLAPVAAGAAAAGAVSALTEVAESLGGNIAANWIDKHGPDALRSLLSGPLSLPRHDDMVRVADSALSAAIGHFLAEIAPEAKGDAGVDFTNSLKRLQEQAKSHTTRLPAAEADAAITQALTHLSSHGAAQALSLLLADAIAPDMRRGGEREYAAEWHALARRLQTRLPDLLSAYLAEALKSDERFFRAVTVTLHAAQVQTGQDVLTALQALDQKLSDLRADLTARLPQDHGIDLTGFIKDVKESLAAFQSAIQAEFNNDRAPPLTWYEPGKQEGHDLSLLYYDRKAPFVGRDAPLAALNHFIDDPAPLLWTTITGGAGVGKSRLVLEALSLRRLTGGVEAGFMQPSNGWMTAKRYENWRAPVPTVLIVDYAGVSPELVRDLIHNLACRVGARTLAAPVRLLLLDTHPNRGDFALSARIKDSTTGGKQAARVEWQGDARTVLDLSPLTQEDLFTVSALYRGAALTVAEMERVMAAVKADPELARPLFAALMGLALRHGTDTPLTLAGVTSHFLDRQEQHWAKRDPITKRERITPLDRTLLALATLGGSVPLADVLKDPLIADLVDKPNRLTLRQNWASMTGKPLPDTHLTKLEPDYVGGLYLLRHLRQIAPGSPREVDEVSAERDRLITLAWKYGDPRETLTNLTRNFAGEWEWVRLVTRLIVYRPAGVKGICWSLIAPEIVFELSQRNANRQANLLLKAMEQHNSPLDRIQLISAYCARDIGFNFDFKTISNLMPNCDERISQIKILLKEKIKNIDAISTLTYGIFFDLFSENDNDICRCFIKDALTIVRCISEEFPNNINITTELASGLCISILENQENILVVDNILDELRSLVILNNNSVDMVIRLAVGIASATSNYGNDLDRSTKLLSELRSLARNEVTVAPIFADILLYHMNWNDWHPFFAQIEELLDIYPDNDLIIDKYATAIELITIIHEAKHKDQSYLHFISNLYGLYLSRGYSVWLSRMLQKNFL